MLEPELDEVVTYSLTKDKRGRPCAANATLAGDKLAKRAPKKSSRTAIVFALLFFAVLLVSAIAGKLSPLLLIGYTVLSVVTFIAYALDKSAAQSGSWRTGEGSLLLLGLAGGWPGALIAQQTLRHKTKKASFRSAFWITVMVNCAALGWLHTDNGKDAVRNLLAQADSAMERSDISNPERARRSAGFKPSVH